MDNKTDLQMLQAAQAAEFALTPAGQEIKKFEVFQRMGKMFAESSIIPQQYRGNLADCTIAVEMASRMGASPLMVLQNLYIVHGMPSFSSKFLLACINASKKYSPLRYEFKGEPGSDDYGCRCVAYEINDKERKDPLYGTWVTMGMAKTEGWSTKNASKWRSMREQMLSYRALAFWQRLYCPEISMGFLTTEEAEDIAPQRPAVVDGGYAEEVKVSFTAPQPQEKPQQMEEKAANQRPEDLFK